MQHKVPQGIEMQDRILGPLTLMQFGFLLFGGLVSYLLYLRLPSGFNTWTALLFMSVSLAVSFEYVRRMIYAAILFVIKPRARIWHKASSPINNAGLPRRQPKKFDISQEVTRKKPEEISRLSQILDSHGKQ